MPGDNVCIWSCVFNSKHNVTADDVIKSKKILLKHKDLQIDIKTCLDYGKINIGRKSYEYLYITPGLEQIFTNTSTLVIDGKEIELQHDLAFNNNAKLLIGSLLLNNDFNFAFENSILSHGNLRFSQKSEILAIA